MHSAPSRDGRVEKIRRHLREGTTIPKEDFLDFVNVYPFFHQSGFKIRPGLTKWIEENKDVVLGWLPDILRARPGYFGDPLSSNFKEFDTLVSLGVAPQPQKQIPPPRGSSNSKATPDLDMPPTRPRERTLADFGTPIPDSVVQKRPSLSGQIQQQIWLDDIREIHKHLRKLNKWLVRVADGLASSDGMKELLLAAAKKTPDLSHLVETAQACFDDVKQNYENACAEQARKREELSRLMRFSPSFGADDDHTPPREPHSENEQDLSSIWVESDIIPPTRKSGGATIASTRLNSSHSPTVKSGKSQFPRRYAMPTSPKIATSGVGKRPRPSSSHSSSVNSIQDSESDDEPPSELSQSGKTTRPEIAGRSVYSINDSDDEAGHSRPKRIRVSMGEARRPPRTQTLGTHGSGNVPEAVMG